MELTAKGGHLLMSSFNGGLHQGPFAPLSPSAPEEELRHRLIFPDTKWGERQRQQALQVLEEAERVGLIWEGPACKARGRAGSGSLSTTAYTA